MTKLNIVKAVRKNRPARVLIAGPSGSGKSYSGLSIAYGLLTPEEQANSGDFLLAIDSEKASLLLYAGVIGFEFSHADLPSFEPETYIEALKAAKDAGFRSVFIDSVSHLWMQTLDTSKKMTGNSFTNWGKLHAKVDAFTKAVLDFPGHVVLTTRAKMKYEQGMDGDKKTVTPVGLDPIMKDGFEYEVDMFGMIDTDHHMAIRKTRFAFLSDKIFTKPGPELGSQVRDWLASGAPAPVVAAGKAANKVAAQAADCTNKGVPTSSVRKEGTNEIPPFTGDMTTLGDYVVQTKCSKGGKSLLEIATIEPAWMEAALTKYASKMLPQDLSAINAYVKVLNDAEAKLEASSTNVLPQIPQASESSEAA